MNGWLAFVLFVVVPNALLALYCFGPDLIHALSMSAGPAIPRGTPKARARAWERFWG